MGGSRGEELSDGIDGSARIDGAVLATSIDGSASIDGGADIDGYIGITCPNEPPFSSSAVQSEKIPPKTPNTICFQFKLQPD